MGRGRGQVREREEGERERVEEGWRQGGGERRMSRGSDTEEGQDTHTQTHMSTLRKKEREREGVCSGVHHAGGGGRHGGRRTRTQCVHAGTGDGAVHAATGTPRTDKRAALGCTGTGVRVAAPRRASRHRARLPAALRFACCCFRWVLLGFFFHFHHADATTSTSSAARSPLAPSHARRRCSACARRGRHSALHPRTREGKRTRGEQEERNGR